MNPKIIFGKRLSLVIVGFGAVVALLIIGHKGLGGYLPSQAATDPYAAVLAKMQSATSSGAIYNLAQQAGLDITSSSQSDSSNALDKEEEIFITNPQTNDVLAAVTEYDDYFSSSPPVPVVTSTAPAFPSSSTLAPEVSVQANIKPSSGQTPSLLGDELDLRWNSQNADSCTVARAAKAPSLAGSTIVASGASGELSVDYPYVLSSVYTVSCAGPGGKVNTTVAIGPTPSETFVTTSTSVSTSTIPRIAMNGVLTQSASSGELVLTWSSQNATVCKASGAWSGAQALSGTSAQVPATGKTSVYTLTCTGPGGYATASVTATGPSSMNIPAGPGLQNLSFNNFLHMPVAYAQTTGGSTVVGSNSGQTQICTIPGANGDANIFVYPNGQLYGVNGNYNFSIDNEGTNGTAPGFTQQFDDAASAADSAINNLGGIQGSSANNSTNNITAVVNNDTDSNVALKDDNGIALAISTLQPDGTYNNSCSANLFVQNTNMSTNGSSIYMQNAFTHEIGHCLGLAHSDDPKNIMYEDPLSDTVLLTFNPVQIQYLKDRAAGKTIQIDPNNCSPVCNANEGFVPATPGNNCVSQQTLCAATPGSIWNDQTQSCITCPAGSVADLDSGSCDFDPFPSNQNSGCTPEQLADGWVNDGNGGCRQPTTTSTSVIDPEAPTTTDPETGSSTMGMCMDDNGNSYPCFAPMNSSTIISPASSTDDISSSSVPVDCSLTPDDPSCLNTTDYCAQNPTDSDCQSYCAQNPTDLSCSGADNASNFDSSDGGGGGAITCYFFDGGNDVGRLNPQRFLAVESDQLDDTEDIICGQ